LEETTLRDLASRIKRTIDLFDIEVSEEERSEEEAEWQKQEVLYEWYISHCFLTVVLVVEQVRGTDGVDVFRIMSCASSAWPCWVMIGTCFLCFLTVGDVPDVSPQFERWIAVETSNVTRLQKAQQANHRLKPVPKISHSHKIINSPRIRECITQKLFPPFQCVLHSTSDESKGPSIQWNGLVANVFAISFWK
jgi:hypothetical protein